jgi:hypothetical protein
MKALQCGEIRKMIAVILSVNIDEIRAAKDNQFFYEFDVPPTDDEVDAFIISSECFDDGMKEWLVGEVGIVLVEE